VRTIKKRLNTRRNKRVKRTLRKKRYLSKKRGGAWWNRTKNVNDTNKIINFGNNEPTSSYRRERSEKRNEQVDNYYEKKNFIEKWLGEEWARRYDSGTGQHEPTDEEANKAWEQHLKNNVM
jgi:hypothetical protein